MIGMMGMALEALQQKGVDISTLVPPKPQADEAKAQTTADPGFDVKSLITPEVIMEFLNDREETLKSNAREINLLKSRVSQLEGQLKISERKVEVLREALQKALEAAKAPEAGAADANQASPTTE